MVVLFGIPVIQVLLFGFVIRNEIRNIRIAILDHSKDAVTREITDHILSSGYYIYVGTSQNQADIDDMFKGGIISQAIIFEPDFERNLERENQANMRIITDASDPNTARMISNYTLNIVNTYTGRLNVIHAFKPPVGTQLRMLYNENLKSVYMFIPGIMAMILMLVSAMITSISITREKELGTMEILLVSPLNSIQIILGKVTPYLLLSFLNAIIIVILGTYVFKVPVRGSMALLLAECLLFAFLALSLGIMISTFTNSQQVAMMLSMFALMLPTILLSGFIFPIENMPKALQVLSHIIPPKWFVIIIKNIMLKGGGLTSVWKETLILGATTLFFILVSIKKFKYRLES